MSRFTTQRWRAIATTTRDAPCTISSPQVTPLSSWTAGRRGNRRAVWRRIAGKMAKKGLTWRYRRFAPGAQPAHLVRIRGLQLLVSRGVFDPAVHFTSAFFASYIGRCHLLPGGLGVLDMGTGSGILAIAAARSGAHRVVAVDINPVAVQCALRNAARYNLAHRVEARVGDLFNAVQGERFDVILCNPPYFRGVPENVADYAYKCGLHFEWLERFAIESHDYLSACGHILIVLGDAADLSTILTLLRRCGWNVQEVARRDILVEVLSVYSLTPRADWHSPIADCPPRNSTTAHLD